MTTTLPPVTEHPAAKSAVDQLRKAQAARDQLEAEVAECQMALTPPRTSWDDSEVLPPGRNAALIDQDTMQRATEQLIASGFDANAIPSSFLESVRSKLARLAGLRKLMAKAVQVAEKEVETAKSKAAKEVAAEIRPQYEQHVARCVDAARELRAALLAADEFMTAVESKSGYSSVFSSWLRSIRGRWHVSTESASPDDFMLFQREMEQYGLYKPGKK